MILWLASLTIAASLQHCGTDAVKAVLAGGKIPVCVPVHTVPMVAFDTHNKDGHSAKLGSERAKALSRALWREMERRGTQEVPKQSATVTAIVLARVRESVPMLVNGAQVLVPASKEGVAAAHEHPDAWSTQMGAEVMVAAVLGLAPRNPLSRLMNPWPVWELGFVKGWIPSNGAQHQTKIQSIGFDAIERRALPLAADVLDQLKAFVTRAVRRSRGQSAHCDDKSKVQAKKHKRWKAHSTKCTALAVLVAVETQAVSIEQYKRHIETAHTPHPKRKADTHTPHPTHAEHPVASEKASKVLFASMGLDVRRRRRATTRAPMPAATLLPTHQAPETTSAPQPWTAWRHRQPTASQPPAHTTHIFEAKATGGIFDPDAIEGDGIADAGLTHAQRKKARRKRFQQQWNAFVVRRQNARRKGGKRRLEGRPVNFATSSHYTLEDMVQVFSVSFVTTEAKEAITEDGAGGRVLASEQHMALVASAHGEALDAPHGHLKLLSLQTGLNRIAVVVTRAAVYNVQVSTFDAQQQQEFRDSLLTVVTRKLAAKLQSSMGGRAEEIAQLGRLLAWLGDTPHVDITDVGQCSWCGTRHSVGFRFALALPAHVQDPFVEAISDAGLGPEIMVRLQTLAGWSHLGVGDLKLNQPDVSAVGAGCSR